MLTRALTDLFGSPDLAQALVFRGGTALHKLYLEAPSRYSEDIDLVQAEAGEIGPVLDEMRCMLDPWLGEPRRRRGPDSVSLLYRFETSTFPAQSMRLKVEINTREHFSVLGVTRHDFEVNTLWHAARVSIATYELEELLATKMRALYQRRKGRDLYDLSVALASLDVDEGRLITCFEHYLEHGGVTVSRAQFEANMSAKLRSREFREDVLPLLRDGASYDVDAAAKLVHVRLIARLKGEAWRGGTS
ncbi:MAG: nucleotidyl transferase AbiEii/AbiGii toxin family protein [Thermoleophilia bacterium]